MSSNGRGSSGSFLSDGSNMLLMMLVAQGNEISEASPKLLINRHGINRHE